VPVTPFDVAHASEPGRVGQGRGDGDATAGHDPAESETMFQDRLLLPLLSAGT
jgi:hypothetical protein